MNKFYYNEEQANYDAIVVGTGISGGWAAKELTEKGLRVLVLERGRMVRHVTDYDTANLDPWDMPNGGDATKEILERKPKQSRTPRLARVAPVFFTGEEMVLLTRVADVMLPKTDTPSGSEVGVHKFIDQYALEVMKAKDQAAMKTAIEKIGKGAQTVSKKQSYTDQELETAIVAELKEKKSEVKKLRNLIVFAYKCNEVVGTEVLAYLPVPGEYIPCGDLEELTGGRAWSL